MNDVGVVRARDVDRDGVDAAWLVEYLRQLGAKRDPRLYPGGYVIFNRRITSPDFATWKTYTGSNPHDKHFHVSFSTVRAGFDSTAPWGIASAPTASTDWFAMATKEELAQVVNACIDQRLGRTIWETTGALPNRRGPNGEKVGSYQDTAWGFVMTAEGATYRIEQALAKLSTTPGSPISAGSLSDADVQRVAAAVVSLLGKKASS